MASRSDSRISGPDFGVRNIANVAPSKAPPMAEAMQNPEFFITIKNFIKISSERSAKFKPKHYLCFVNNKKNITVAFTGHREYSGAEDDALRQAICELYNENYRIFLCGMARGFDLAAGECILDLRNKFPDIELVCVIPFYGQEQSFSKSDRERFRRLTELANDVILLSHEYHIRAYHFRNDFMVNNSSAVIAYYNGSAGGTHYTLHRAAKQGLRIINICTFRKNELFNNLK